MDGKRDRCGGERTERQREGCGAPVQTASPVAPSVAHQADRRITD